MIEYFSDKLQRKTKHATYLTLFVVVWNLFSSAFDGYIMSYIDNNMFLRFIHDKRRTGISQ